MYDITGAQAIRETAKKYGLCHSNKFYINQVLRDFGMSVTQTQIVQTIGAAKTRRITVEPSMLKKARSLIDSCHQDIALAMTALKLLDVP